MENGNRGEFLELYGRGETRKGCSWAMDLKGLCKENECSRVGFHYSPVVV